jgi:hypothetical protein
MPDWLESLLALELGNTLADGTSRPRLRTDAARDGVPARRVVWTVLGGACAVALGATTDRLGLGAGAAAALVAVALARTLRSRRDDHTPRG